MEKCGDLHSNVAPMENKASLKGAWLRHVTRLNFGDPIHISGMAEARAVKFCTKGDYKSSFAKGMKNCP